MVLPFEDPGSMRIMYIRWHSTMGSVDMRATIMNRKHPGRIPSLIVYGTLIGALAFVTAPSKAQDATVDMPGHVVGTGPYPFETKDSRRQYRPPIELPDSVASKLELLTDEEIEFLKSGDGRRYAGGPDETVAARDERTPAEVKAWVGAMMDMYAAYEYVEGRDLPNIPLNTGSPEFNAWRAIRPRSMDPVREPGAVPLGRYGGFGGPPTFGGYPLALTMEDLVAAEVDVAIVGAPQNMG